VLSVSYGLAKGARETLLSTYALVSKLGITLEITWLARREMDKTMAMGSLPQFFQLV
jgi:hypothetical protein